MARVLVVTLALEMMPGAAFARRRYLGLSYLDQVGDPSVFSPGTDCWREQRLPGSKLRERLAPDVRDGMEPALRILRKLQPGPRQLCAADALEAIVAAAFGARQVSHFFQRCS